MAKRHLKLVVLNKQPQKNIIQKFWQWLNKRHSLLFTVLPFVTTHLEKKQAIQNYLTLKFAEYQCTTGTVGLFPMCEAINEVEELERKGQIDAYYRKIKRRIAI